MMLDTTKGAKNPRRKHNPPMRVISGFLFGFVLFGIVGCGFQLRGSQIHQAPLPPIQITNELPKKWQRDLQQFLKQLKIQVTEVGEYHILLDRFDEDRRVGSLNSRAKAAEYELHISFHYQIQNKQGETLVSSRKISAHRSYQFDESQVVGKEQEEGLIRNQLQNLLFQKMMRHLRQIHRSYNAT